MKILNDTYAIDDLIGREDYVKGIVEVINSIDSKGSFVIGVYGEWGSGKTSFLRQTMGRLLKTNGDTQNNIYVPVWFNPWQYFNEEHLIIPFFHTLISGTEKNIKGFTDKTISDKLNEFLKNVIKIPFALMYGLKVKLQLSMLELQYSAKDSIDSIKESQKEIGESSKSETEKYANKYESLYYNLIDTLVKSTDKLNSGKLNYKYVIFIDDLDRCFPENAIELLENLKVFLDLPNFVFVIGVAREIIERGVIMRYEHLNKLNQGFYKDSTFEKDYLDKIIQFPFDLPAVSEIDIKNKLIGSFIDNFDIREHVDIIIESLGTNPRSIKRFFNTISFTMYLKNEVLKSNSLNLNNGLIIKLSLIAYLLPSLYKELENNPDILVKIEAEIQKLKFENDFTEIIDINTGLSVDKWLGKDFLIVLLPILKNRENIENFVEANIVYEHLRLIESTFKTNSSSKDTEISINNSKIEDVLRARLINISHLFPKKKTILMDKFPVTQQLYKRIMETNPSKIQGEDLPVANVSWIEAVMFCNALSIISGYEKVYTINKNDATINHDKRGFRLPFKQEWIVALRDGEDTNLYGKLDEIAWYNKNITNTVGKMKPNTIGLHDMIGNVWEWCNDISQTNSFKRVLVGGSITEDSSFFETKISKEDYFEVKEINYGFRIILIK